MKVLELKEALEERNISKKGLKIELISRLKQAIANGMDVVENIDPDILCNMAGENFEPTAHWELLTPDWNELIYDELKDKDGYNFYAPTASGDARQENCHVHAPKLNYKEKFNRPQFIQSVLYPKITRGNRVATDKNENTIYEEKISDESVPNIKFLNDRGITINSHPYKWFDVFMPKHSKRHAHRCPAFQRVSASYPNLPQISVACLLLSHAHYWQWSVRHT